MWKMAFKVQTVKLKDVLKTMTNFFVQSYICEFYAKVKNLKNG